MQIGFGAKGGFSGGRHRASRSLWTSVVCPGLSCLCQLLCRSCREERERPGWLGFVRRESWVGGPKSLSLSVECGAWSFWSCSQPGCLPEATFPTPSYGFHCIPHEPAAPFPSHPRKKVRFSLTLPHKVRPHSLPFHPCRRINVGTRFQAEIPTMRDRSLAAADPHKADLVWQPWEHLESSWEKQRQGKERSLGNRARQAAGQMDPGLNMISCSPNASAEFSG